MSSSSEVSSHISRAVSCLPLAPSLLSVLQAGGFVETRDVLECSPRELSRELNITMESALSILNAIKNSDPPAEATRGSDMVKAIQVGSHIMQSNSQLSSHALMNLPIITFCKGIDALLGGGVPSGQLTELCGVPGIGKTQMSMQLALDVQIPTVFRGCGGEAIYIDTEGSCFPSRLGVMAGALVKHLQQIAKSSATRHNQLAQMSQQETNTPNNAADLRQKQYIVDQKLAQAASISVESLLSGIHLYRTHDQTELLAVIAQLSAFLEAHPKVKLIIIDSIAFPFRQDSHIGGGQESGQRARLLCSVSQDLYRLALTHNVAVVVVNHVTTKVFRSTATSEVGEGFGNNTEIIPALGEIWSHSITNRLMLHWEKSGEELGQERVAYLVKSPCRPCSRATFSILPVGVRDVPPSRNIHHDKSSELHQSEPQQNDKTRIYSEVQILAGDQNFNTPKRSRQE